MYFSSALILKVKLFFEIFDFYPATKLDQRRTFLCSVHADETFGGETQTYMMKTNTEDRKA